jgi:excisionase family DNA binding protein
MSINTIPSSKDSQTCQNYQVLGSTISVEEAAAILGCSKSTLYEQIKAKKFPAIRLGEKRYRVPVAKLNELLGADKPQVDTREIQRLMIRAQIQALETLYRELGL